MSRQELEVRKALAAAARNYKEAGSIYSDIKTTSVLLFRHLMAQLYFYGFSQCDSETNGARMRFDESNIEVIAVANERSPGPARF